MRRLDFVMPDFTRIAWTSERARSTWEPRIQRITEVWWNIEWLSVVAGIRPCGLTVVDPMNLVHHAAEWSRNGLTHLPVEVQGLSHYEYSSTTKPAEPGKPFVYRVVIGRTEDVARFREAWETFDNPGIGASLGYPKCCLDFFQKNWVDKGMVDTTWQTALAGKNLPEDVTEIDVSGPPESNILWRWVGVRTVSHLPCSFNCRATVELGRKIIAVARDNGFAEEMDWLEEIHSWPVEWSALHGIAEIKTPVLKVSTRTDATSCKYTIRRKGIGYPAEGARGLHFPYRIPDQTRVIETDEFIQGIQHSPAATETHPEWFAADNGFEALTSMVEAHKPIIDLALKMVSGDTFSILDLGCGNGALLKSIRDRNPSVIPFGVEHDPDRAKHISAVLPEFSDNFECCDIFNCNETWKNNRKYDLAIVMPGRLIETSSEQAALLREHLRQSCKTVIVYAYGDWLTRFGGLETLSEKAGLFIEKRQDKPRVAFVNKNVEMS